MKQDMTHNRQKKIAIINDMSGFGRCSIAVALPIISVMKIQCCPIPTAIFSNHTGFPSYFFEDYTDRMQPYIDEWKKLALRFDGIASGFLGSREQIQIVARFFQEFKTKDNVIVVDPVMGDYGKSYATYTEQMCAEMKQLIHYADIITPNLTEACILTDTPYHPEKWKLAEIHELVSKLSKMGPAKIVITGIWQGEYIANYCYEAIGYKSDGLQGDGEVRLIRTLKVGTQRSGTGDIFAAIVTADAVNGVPFHISVKKASAFIKKCIQKSIELDIPVTDGVCFEEVLGSLK